METQEKPDFYTAAYIDYNVAMQALTDSVADKKLLMVVTNAPGGKTYEITPSQFCNMLETLTPEE